MKHGLAAALAIWRSGVNAVRPDVLMADFFENDSEFRDSVNKAERLLVVGGGKAGTAMVNALQRALPDQQAKMVGCVNVPADTWQPTTNVKLVAGRPAGVNHPTIEGAAGVTQMLRLMEEAGPNDVAICLISGGGSALLPAPDGVTLADKQTVTQKLHGCGATINEMNAVRKHLSKVKGGRLAQAFRGRQLFSLIISDVIDDPLDVIASGPTAIDQSTFADALTILQRYQLVDSVPVSVINHLKAGINGLIPETLKTPLPNVRNVLLGNNAKAIAAAAERAHSLGYAQVRVLPVISGDTATVAREMAMTLNEIAMQTGKPICVLNGGETTVTLDSRSGKGGRNQEFVLAMLDQLGPLCMNRRVLLSGGTDGEDGPTDAAGAVANQETLAAIHQRGLNMADHLKRHASYDLFDAVNGLIKTGPTHTNVMDLRVMLLNVR